MTTNEPLSPADDARNLAAPIAHLIAASDDTDMLDMLAALKPITPGPVFEMIALMLDMCPIHMTDLDSCADDDALDLDTPAARGPIPLTACRHLRRRD